MELAKDDNLEINKESLQDAGLSDGVVELCIAFLLAERSPKQPSVPADCGSLGARGRCTIPNATLWAERTKR